MTTEERKIIWETALDTVFPGRWDMQPSTREVGQQYLFIHFPEVIIKNDLELEHTIKNLFVKLRFTNKYTLNAHPIGFRSTYSTKELLLNYTHSHISGLGVNNQSIDTNTFCLGSSELVENLRILNQRYNDDSFITEEEILMFLFNLETYVAWESLEGGPYKKIEQLNDWGLLFQNFGQTFGVMYRLTLSDLNGHYKKALPYLKGIDPVLTGSRNNVMFKFQMNQLEGIFNKINTRFCLNKTDYLIPTTSTEFKERFQFFISNGNYGTPFVFKGVPYPFTVDDLDSMSFDNLDVGMPQQLKIELLNKINYEYNKSAKKYFASQKN